jgi:putative salt-induced outer membrane protein YdiY
VGLGALGHHVVRTALVPCIPVYLSLLQASLDASATASTVAIPQGPSRTSSSTSTTTSSSSKPKSASSARQAVVSCSGIPAEWAAAAREKRIATAVDDDAAASSSFSFPASVKFRPASVSNTLASDLSQDRVRAAAEKQTELTHCQGALTVRSLFLFRSSFDSCSYSSLGFSRCMVHLFEIKSKPMVS